MNKFFKVEPELYISKYENYRFEAIEHTILYNKAIKDPLPELYH